MIYLAVLAFGVTLGLPIAVIFASTAQGKATSTALEGIARQPEATTQIQTAMIIGLALILLDKISFLGRYLVQVLLLKWVFW